MVYRDFSQGMIRLELDSIAYGYRRSPTEVPIEPSLGRARTITVLILRRGMKHAEIHPSLKEVGIAA